MIATFSQDDGLDLENKLRETCSRIAMVNHRLIELRVIQIVVININYICAAITASTSTLNCAFGSPILANL